MNRRGFLAGATAACFATLSRAQAIDFATAAAYSAERRGVSLLVMRRGEVIFENYPNEGGAERGWELASGTKSFTGVMAAAAIQDGLIASWDESAAETLNEWRDDARRDITLRHLLSLTSGIEGGPIARPPTYADAIAQPAGVAPGERFAYGPTPFQIFGEIMRRKTSADPLAYLQQRIFDPLGIEPARWRRGADGNPHMPSGAALSARDWARFGWFVMQNGEGRVDAHALAQCFEGSRANPGYGLSWWLLRNGLVRPGRNAGLEIDTALSRRLGGVSMAAGAGDQRLYLLPALDLVVVRQATGILQALMRHDSGPRWSDAEFLRRLIVD
ncbi:MAG TPA: serine hydrolase domain-containing protein [Candidatus Binatia bacterium]|nr:serine hydrolase domain-containing protein [Candidatus Binatia bacterium]